MCCWSIDTYFLLMENLVWQWALIPSSRWLTHFQDVLDSLLHSFRQINQLNDCQLSLRLITSSLFYRQYRIGWQHIPNIVRKHTATASKFFLLKCYFSFTHTAVCSNMTTRSLCPNLICTVSIVQATVVYSYYLQSESMNRSLKSSSSGNRVQNACRAVFTT